MLEHVISEGASYWRVRPRLDLNPSASRLVFGSPAQEAAYWRHMAAQRSLSRLDAPLFLFSASQIVVALPRMWRNGMAAREILLACLMALPTLTLAALHHPRALRRPGAAAAVRALRAPFHAVSHAVMTLAFARIGARPEMRACVHDRVALELLALFQLSQAGYSVLAALPYAWALGMQTFAAAGFLYLVPDLCAKGMASCAASAPYYASTAAALSSAAAGALPLPAPPPPGPLPPLPSCKALITWCTAVCQLLIFHVWHRRAEARSRALYARHVGDARAAAALEATRQPLPREVAACAAAAAALWIGIVAAVAAA